MFKLRWVEKICWHFWPCYNDDKEDEDGDDDDEEEEEEEGADGDDGEDDEDDDEDGEDVDDDDMALLRARTRPGQESRSCVTRIACSPKPPWQAVGPFYKWK